MLNKKINAFTISELMVTLALTGIMSSFAYMGYNYTQKLLNQFNEQNYFITQLSELNRRLTLLSNLSKEVTKENDSKFFIKSDSINYSLEFTSRNIFLNKSGVTDTFHLETIELKSESELMNNQLWHGKLINKIEFDVVFQKETFHISFNKKYDAYSKLMLETQSSN